VKRFLTGDQRLLRLEGIGLRSLPPGFRLMRRFLCEVEGAQRLLSAERLSKAIEANMRVCRNTTHALGDTLGRARQRL
jgi:hypothetical protein